jgi:hypothetical protein
MRLETGRLIPINEENKAALDWAFRAVGLQADLDAYVEMVNRVADMSGTQRPDVVGIEVKPGRNASVITATNLNSNTTEIGLFVTPEFAVEMTAKPLIGAAVIAHEIGHIACGHQGTRALHDMANGKLPNEHQQEFDADAFAKKLGLGNALAESLEDECESKDPNCPCMTVESQEHPSNAERIRRLREK